MQQLYSIECSGIPSGRNLQDVANIQCLNIPAGTTENCALPTQSLSSALDASLSQIDIGGPITLPIKGVSCAAITIMHVDKSM